MKTSLDHHRIDASDLEDPDGCRIEILEHPPARRPTAPGSPSGGA